MIKVRLQMSDMTSVFLAWLIVAQGYAIAVPDLRIVIPRRVVLYATVVPHRDGMRFPAKAALKIDMLHVSIKKLKCYSTLTCLQRG